eukprot:CAMPEP_0202864650 /NCGR_PEP_ID=MMETSP1391-20130828/4806_1 /ASSEMBLY_ACC=CAM_ASM_000867 /TAXON_ID=1034604 /ORGANISM="Chlamydomonas leiostraca, Strain SAG 11-49" /LENGTH=1382 /DNA_ID=CAMNT_0049544415 /DNA_START=218 /DNA_END=4365 /DNA_ORIENTATION=+
MPFQWCPSGAKGTGSTTAPDTDAQQVAVDAKKRYEAFQAPRAWSSAPLAEPSTSSSSVGHSNGLDSSPSRPVPVQRLSSARADIPSKNLVPSPSQVKPARVKFTVPEFVTSPGQTLVIVGSVPALGSWDTEKATRMTWHTGHRWTAEIELEPGWHGAVEFKVAMEERRAYSWEPGGNRLLVVERPRARSQQSAASISVIAHATTTLRSNAATDSTASGSAALEAAAAAAAGAPTVEVVCDWGKTEAPSPALPEVLQCGPAPGMLANGSPLASALRGGRDAGAGAAMHPPGLVMAHTHIVIPVFVHPGLCAGPNAAGSVPGAASMDARGSGGASGTSRASSPSGSSGGSSSDESSGPLSPNADPSARGHHVVLVGSVPALGCWDPAQGLRLACDESGMWRGRVELPMGFPVQAKLVVMEGSTPKQWEAGPNRVIRLPDPPTSLLQSMRRAGPGASGSSAAAAAAAAGTSLSNGHHNGHMHAPSSPTTASSNGHAAAVASSLHHGSSSNPAAPATAHGHHHGSGRRGGATASPVMEGGEFMVVAHWGLPTFPQLLFLPQVDPPPAGSATDSLDFAPRTVPCRFTVPHLATHPGQQLLLVGGAPTLGNWDPTNGLRLRWGPGHTWQAAGVALPADSEVEAKLVLWDGHAYRWEEGPNRRLRPGELVSNAVPEGAWGEAAFMMYWGAAARSTHAPPGHTPAVVIPRDRPEPLDLTTGPTAGVLHHHSSTAAAAGARHGPSATDLLKLAASAAANGSSNGVAVAPEQSLLHVVSFLTSLAVPGSELAHGAAGAAANGSGKAGAAAAGANVAAASRLAALEAQVDAAHGALADATLARAREMDSLRAQLAQSALALAAEEDEVEALHAALGAKQAELNALRTALANAEATAAAAVAAATTALTSSGLQLASPNSSGSAATASDTAASSGSTQGGEQPLNGVAAAMFQALTDQLAARQLEVDTLRRAAADAAAARTAEVAHLRVELSEAVAAKHREVEGARVAAASAALSRQQEVSALMGQLAELQAAREREVAALQARVDSVLAAGQQETGRLSRQLNQACAAVEALEAQLNQERGSASAKDSAAGAEIARLRAAVAAREAELEALRSVAADASAAAAGRMAAARATRGAAANASGDAASGGSEGEDAGGPEGNPNGPALQDGGDSVGLAALEAARREAAAHAAEAALLRTQLESAAGEVRALQNALQAAGSLPGLRGGAGAAAGSSAQPNPGQSCGEAGAGGASATEQLRRQQPGSSNGASGSTGDAHGPTSHPISFLIRRLSGRGVSPGGSGGASGHGHGASDALAKPPSHGSSAAAASRMNNIVSLSNGNGASSNGASSSNSGGAGDSHGSGAGHEEDGEEVAAAMATAACELRPAVTGTATAGD